MSEHWVFFNLFNQLYITRKKTGKCFWFKNDKNLKKSSYPCQSGGWSTIWWDGSRSWLRLKECLWCSFNIQLWLKCKDTQPVVTNFYEQFQLLKHRGRWRRIKKEFNMIGHRSQESSMTSDIAIIDSVWLRPFIRLPYCPNLVWHVPLYLQKEQEDSFREVEAKRTFLTTRRIFDDS